MAGITITGQKSLATLNKEFQAQFPYLYLQFFTKEEWDRAQAGADTVHSLDMSQRLASMRVTKPSAEEKELSIHGNTLVKNREKIYTTCTASASKSATTKTAADITRPPPPAI